MDIKLRNMTSVYFTNDTGVLCLYRIGSRIANKLHVGAAGGHFEMEELNDPKRCVLRELREELGLVEADVTDLRLRYITHRLKNGEIRQNYYYFAKLKEDRPLRSTEGELRWIAYEDLPRLQMPVSAKAMMMHYLETGRFDNELYCGVTEERGTVFVPMKDFEDAKEAAQ